MPSVSPVSAGSLNPNRTVPVTFRCCFLQEIKHFFLCMEQRLTEHLRTEEFFHTLHFLFNRLPAWIFCSSFSSRRNGSSNSRKAVCSRRLARFSSFSGRYSILPKNRSRMLFSAHPVPALALAAPSVLSPSAAFLSGPVLSALLFFLLPAHFLSHFPPSGARTLLPGGSFSAAVSMFPVMPRKAESAPPASVPHTRPSARQLRKATILFRSLLRRQIPSSFRTCAR